MVYDLDILYLVYPLFQEKSITHHLTSTREMVLFHLLFVLIIDIPYSSSNVLIRDIPCVIRSVFVSTWMCEYVWSM